MASAPATPVPIEPEPKVSKPQPETAEVSPEPPAPAPPIEPQPIFDVQARTIELTERYSEKLIQGVNVNFQDKQLVVRVSDRWYTLESAQQDDLGRDALQQSQRLDFRTLELRDPEDKLLARNPVVGSDIIVLQRRRRADTTL